MPSADHRLLTRRAVALPLLTLALLPVAAVAASADVVRITQPPTDGQQGPSPTRVATFDLAAPAPLTAGTAIDGLPGAPSQVALAPDRGLAAFVARSADGEDPTSVGTFPIGGGAVRAFAGADGRPVAPGSADAWLSWRPDATSVVLHDTLASTSSDPLSARATSRRCDVATARCAPPATGDAVYLVGGGTVRISGPAVDDSAELDHGSRAVTRRLLRLLATRGDRRRTVRVRVTGRPGAAPATWTTGGTLRHGAPAYDRAWPGPGGVLVTTRRLRIATITYDGSRAADVDSTGGPALVVGRDGRPRSLGRLDDRVVGTTPDGRWLLANPDRSSGSYVLLGSGLPLPVAATPLRTVDAAGRITVLRAGGRPVTPVWAAYAAGLPDSVATSARVRSAGVDSTTGELVLVLGYDPELVIGPDPEPFLANSQVVVAVPLDGSEPPRVVPQAGPKGGGRVRAGYLVR